MADLPAGFELVADGLAFPEGPVVMADGSVIVVEIGGGRITRCWSGRTETVATPGGGPNGAAIGPDGALYVCNNGGLPWLGRPEPGRVERIDLSTGKVERLFDRCGDDPLSAPNDLVFDAEGNLWFSDLGKRRKRSSDVSALYCARPDGSAIVRIHDQAMSYNGVGLSPDGSTIYVADTFQARLYAFDRRVEPQTPRFVATVPGPLGLDSLAVTAAGTVCVATIERGGIASVFPDGRVAHLPIDERYVTNIAFGGPDMCDVWITLSSTGRLVRTRWAEPGLKLAFNG